MMQWEFEDPLVGRFFCGWCSLLEDHGNNNPRLGDGWDMPRIEQVINNYITVLLVSLD